MFGSNIYFLISCALFTADLVSAHIVTGLRPRDDPSDMHVCEVDYTPPPKNVHKCEYEGKKNKKVTPLADTIGQDFDSCRDSCLIDNPQCASFSYANATVSADSECKLYDTSVRSMTTKKTFNTGIFFYSRRCFTVQTYSDTALTNGDFETGDLSPWTASPDSIPGDSLSITDGGDASQYAVRFASSPSQGNSIGQTFSICNGTTYNIYYSYYLESGATFEGDGSGALLFVYSNDFGGGATGFGNNTLVDQWVDQGPFAFTTNRTGTLQFQITLVTGSGSQVAVRVDNVVCNVTSPAI